MFKIHLFEDFFMWIVVLNLIILIVIEIYIILLTANLRGLETEDE